MKEEECARLKKLPGPFTWEENRKIYDNDTIIGVYFLFDGDEVVYVGHSKNVFNRVRTHTKDKDFTSWNYIILDIDDLECSEADMILKYKPKYNIGIPKNNTWISGPQARKKYNLTSYKFNNMIKDNVFSDIVFFKGTYVLINDLERELCL